MTLVYGLCCSKTGMLIGNLKLVMIVAGCGVGVGVILVVFAHRYIESRIGKTLKFLPQQSLFQDPTNLFKM